MERMNATVVSESTCTCSYCLFNAMNTVGPEFHVSSDCRQDCELSFEPIFTKYGTQLPLNFSKKFLGRPKDGRGQDHVTKFAILHPLIISARLNDMPRYSDFTLNLGRSSTTKIMSVSFQLAN